MQIAPRSLRGLHQLALVAALSLAFLTLPAAAQMRITEWMYAGSSPVGGEFVEFTNVGDVPIDMTGWSFDDDHRVPGAFDLSAFGVVMPGESVILTEDDPDDFRADWNLPPRIRIVGDLGNPIGNNLGRNDEINLYDAKGDLVDRLTYGDQDFPGSIRTRWFSGSPVSLDVLGQNDPYGWILTTDGDALGSWTSANGDVGNPGSFTLVAFEPIDVAINEVMASNATTLQDEDGDSPDWIELFNHGTKVVQLEGFGLSDSASNPFKWTFQNVELQPGQYLVVFASGKDRHGTTLHTNFSISASGESLSLTAPGGQPVDIFPATAMTTDISVGRVPNGTGDWFFFNQPTPGAPNSSTAFLGIVPEVTFSVPRGMYTEAFELHLACADPLAEIRYTLDGTTPNQDAPLYEGPILIDSRVGDPNVFCNHQQSPDEGYYGPPEEEIFKITMVRARATRANYIQTPVASASYMVDPLGADRYAMPIVSIITHPNNLFAHVGGIFIPGAIYENHYNPNTIWYGRPANYNRRGRSWERSAHIEFWESDGTLGFASRIGLRIHGFATRAFHRKAFRVYFRGEYGMSTLEYPLFGPDGPNQFKRILLRSSGNDWARSLIRDGYMQQLVRDTGIDTQEFRPAVLFVNGEYWGLTNIRERYDRHYLGFTHGVDPNGVDLLSNNQSVTEGSAAHYAAMMNFVQTNDMADDANFEVVETMMDVDNYITYNAVQVFLRNHDWPQNNVRYWREQTPEGRWRWMLFDTDFGFGFQGGSTAYQSNSLYRLLVSLTGWGPTLVRQLIKNEGFKHRFINRSADLMNTVFLPSVTVPQLDALEEQLEPLVPEHIARWNRPSSMTIWHDHIQTMRTFGNLRPNFVRSHYVARFGLGGQVAVTVDVAQPDRGSVGISTIDLADVPLPWTGTYFQNVPIPLHAQPAPGYRFLGWAGHPLSADQTLFHVVADEPTLELVALFAIPGDLNGDDVIDAADLGLLLAAWGACPQDGGCAADLNGDGVVDAADLGILLGSWFGG